jgi:hypothetical protein
MLELLHALEKRLDLTEKMFGEYSEYINLKKLNNLY